MQLSPSSYRSPTHPATDRPFVVRLVKGHRCIYQYGARLLAICHLQVTHASKKKHKECHKQNVTNAFLNWLQRVLVRIGTWYAQAAVCQNPSFLSLSFLFLIWHIPSYCLLALLFLHAARRSPSLSPRGFNYLHLS